MAVTGTPTSGDDTLTGDGADDEVIGQEGSDSIDGGGGNDTIYGDVRLLDNGELDSNQSNNSWGLRTTLDGWFNTGSSGRIETWGDGFFGLSPADGSAFIELDVHGNGGLDHLQTNLELDTGLTYTLSFDHAARPGSGVNDDFEVTHNGIVIATISPSSIGSFTTTEVTITGVSGTDTIGFREIAGQSNGVGVLLDNVQISLTQAEVDAGSFTYDDILDGGAGDDNIYGQEGDDTITGGTGNDYMEGGIGDDVFVLADGSGSDVIGDFTIGEDLLDVSNLTDATGNPVDVDDATVTSDGEGGSILTFPNGEQIRLRNIAPSDLDTDQELRDIGIPCFVAGAMIMTTRGEIAVEDLVEGDGIVTLCSNGGRHVMREIRRIFRREVVTTNPKLHPVRILAGALGNGAPKRDLLVSRQHRMLVQSKIADRMFGTPEVLIPAIKLTELPGIFVEEEVETVEYFHLLFDQHEVIYAEGAPTESLFTGPETLKAISPEAREEIMAIFPEIADLDYKPTPARYIPEGKQQKHLMARHLKNNKPCLAGSYSQSSQMF